MPNTFSFRTLKPKALRAFPSAYLFIFYFTSSKPTLFTLPLNIYNIPHILLFILQISYKNIIKQSQPPPTPAIQMNPQTHHYENQ